MIRQVRPVLFSLRGESNLVIVRGSRLRMGEAVGSSPHTQEDTAQALEFREGLKGRPR